MNPIFIVLAVLALVGVVVLLKGKKKEKSPAVTVDGIHVQSSPEPLLEAGLWAANYWHGRSEVTTVGYTDSMLPLLDGGEHIVLAHDFANVKIGSVVAYRTVSGVPINGRLLHRVVGGNATTGWIPKGDSPGQPVEDWNPITQDNYIGTLVAVFRQK